jgi:hypothetical protein
LSFSQDHDDHSLHVLAALVSQRLSPHDVPSDRWEEIIALAYKHELGPMLLWVIRQSGLEDSPLWRPLIRQARVTGVRQLRFECAQAEVQTALDQAQIPAIWLKGSALARTVYPRPSLRPMGDLDILVPYAMQEQALQTVTSIGYHFYSNEGKLLADTNELGQKLTHHYHLRGGIDDSVILELHFRLLGVDQTLLSLEHLAWFWPQTETVLDKTNRYTILRPEAHLLYLCAHAILQHGEYRSNLRQYFDLNQLVQHHTMDWDLILKQAVIFRWGYVVERALTLAVGYFGTPVPDEVFQKLEALSASDKNTARAFHLQDNGARWERMRTILAQLSFREKLQMTRQVVFPRRTYMYTRYHIEESQRVWPYYFVRWWDQSKTILWWFQREIVWRFKRTPSVSPGDRSIR